MPAQNCRLSTLLGFILFLMTACSVITLPYDLVKGTVKTAYTASKFVVISAYGTSKVIYKIGKLTFKVVQAPLTWPLTHDLDSIAGLPPREAIKQGKVKNAPYVVKGRRYVPMSVQRSRSYKEIGTASWYGQETRSQPGGQMTANGEVFDPNQLTAAHKYLPLPSYVRVTNLHNTRSIIVRVNDRGPFVADRIIDLSAGAAKRLGFYERGTARVKVETVMVKGT